LLGSREIVESIFEIFTQCPEIGIVAPQHLEGIREWLGWGDNFELSRRLARRLGVEMHINATLDFPSGSMFWARTAALTRLWDALSLDDFPYDHLGYQLDGTMAHAVERLFFVAAEVAGFSWVKVAYPKAFEYTRTIKFASDASELRELIKRYTRKLLTKEMMLESEKDDNHA
jgi:lipopolysaccharide biosynthesis protein